eukprot:6339121-Pyramimonas_sp.AAC.1
MPSPRGLAWQEVRAAALIEAFVSKREQLRQTNLGPTFRHSWAETLSARASRGAGGTSGRSRRD